MKFIDLCCGIGGFHQAMTKLGDMECILACDIDSDCRDIYERNYGLRPLEDLRDVDISQVHSFDILCAGFPCQPFSKAGTQNGFKDDRGNVFFEICKYIEYHRPSYIILENVRNLASHDDGNTWIVIRNKIRKLGYNTYDKPLILNTLYFGVPQSRERVVILCKREDLGVLPNIPDVFENIPTNVSTIIDNNITHSYLSDKLKTSSDVWDDFLSIMRTHNISIPKFPIWTDWWDSDGENTSITKRNPKLTDEQNTLAIQKRREEFLKKYDNWIGKNRCFYNLHKTLLDEWLITSRGKPEWSGAVRKMEWQTADDSLTMRDVLWSPRGSGIRIKKTDYTPTLVAMASMIPVYGPLSRELTPRECARLQSFPDSFTLHDNDKIAYKQFGNAVNVTMIERCARFLIRDESLFVTN